MRTTTDIILAIDPGLRDLGYAALTGKHLLDHGVLTLRHVPPPRRLGRVREAVERWIQAVEPDVLVLEHIPRRPLDSKAGLPSLGRLLRRIAKAHGIDVVSYSAKAVRKSVLNDGWAGKPEVAASLVGCYPQLRVYHGQNRKWKDRYWQNMFDAIALALHHQATPPPSRSRFSD